jgi:flagellin-like protein
MKRGISPLIAGVLLIGFTIVLAVLVITGVGGVVKQQTEGTTIQTQAQNICLDSLNDFIIGFSWNPLYGYKAVISNTGSNTFEGIQFSWYDSSGVIGNSSYVNTPLNAYGSLFVSSGIDHDYVKTRFVPILEGGVPCPVIEKTININKDDFNLLSNPSFEIDSGIDFFPTHDTDDRISGNLIPDGWGNSSQMILDPVDGIYSIQEGYSTSEQDIPSTIGNKYVINGYVKIDNTCFNNPICVGSIGVHCLNSSHTQGNTMWGCPIFTPLATFPWAYVKNTSWQYVEYEVEVDHIDAEYIQIICYRLGFNGSHHFPPDNITAAGGGIAYCDDFGLYKI